MKSIYELTIASAESEYPNPDDESRIIGLQDAFMNGAKWERSRDKWISVKDSLPEIGEYVSVFSSVGIPFKGYLLDNGWVAFFADGEQLCTGEPHHITHWQPLPKPPKQNS